MLSATNRIPTSNFYFLVGYWLLNHRLICLLTDPMLSALCSVLFASALILTFAPESSMDKIMQLKIVRKL